MGWHGKTDIVPDLDLNNNWLRKWNIVPVRLTKNGKESRWSILECSDLPGVEIGEPYNPDTFRPIDNEQFLEMVEKCIAGTEHKVASVGSLRNRGRIFVSIELMGMEKFKAAGRDFNAYLNFGNGHDKSSVLWVNTSNTCTVCDNTFTANLYQTEVGPKKESDSNLRITQRHTKNVLLELPKIANLVDKAVGVQAEFQLELDRLSQQEISVPVVTKLFTGFIGRNMQPKEIKPLSTRSSNQVDRLLNLFALGKGNSGRNLADAFSAVTDYYTHESSGGERIFRQVASSEYGAGNQAKQDFWRIIRKEDSLLKTIERGEEIQKAPGLAVANN